MDPVQVSKTEVIHELLPDPWTGLGVLIVLGVICYGLIRLRAIWRDDADHDASRRELLTQFRESEREGVLTAEEYRLIKSRLGRPVKPATETERREPAETSTASGKGFNHPATADAETGKLSNQNDNPR
jgi:hypothetical protein